MQENQLQDLTLAELWELFPIVLTAHNPHGQFGAEEEMRLLSSLLVNITQSLAISAVLLFLTFRPNR